MIYNDEKQQISHTALSLSTHFVNLSKIHESTVSQATDQKLIKTHSLHSGLNKCSGYKDMNEKQQNSQIVFIINISE